MNGTRACLLSSQGWSQSAIAAELGYADRGEVSKTTKRVLAETARETGTEVVDAAALDLVGVTLLVDSKPTPSATPSA